MKKGTGHRGETSRSKDVALGSLAVRTPHYVGVRGPGPGTPPWFPACHVVIITGLSGRLKENLRDMLSSLVLGNYGLNKYT